MVHHVLAFDLDGTLLQHVGDVVFDDPESLAELCIRDRVPQQRVLELVNAGHDVHVVTARGRKVRAVTLQQVRDIHPDIKVHHQERFTGFIAMRDWKAKKLRELGAEVYVGDHLVDELAAGDAGIPFMHVDKYRSGNDLLALVGDPEGLALPQYEGTAGAVPAGLDLGAPALQVQRRRLGVRSPGSRRVQKAQAKRARARNKEGVSRLHGTTKAKPSVKSRPGRGGR